MKNVRVPEFWIALPDSFLAEASGLRDKTLKIGAVARSSAIFQVTRIHLYHHRGQGSEEEGHLIKEVLEYLDLPQYLRRRLYPKKEEFSYVGLLPPLRTPPHTVPPRPQDVRAGDFREGIVVQSHGAKLVDVGFPRPVTLEGAAEEGERVTVRIVSMVPQIRCEVSSRTSLDAYWGYTVLTKPSLGSVLKEAKADLIILTSRKGASVAEKWGTLLESLSSASKALLVFGSTKEGVYEILRKEGLSLQSFTHLALNMFPDQGTATVRVEEALLGSLAIMNLASALARSPKH